MNQLNNTLQVNHFDLYKHTILNNTVCNVQLSQKLAPRVFPPSPFSKEKLQFLRYFRFHYADLNVSEDIQLSETLVEHKYRHATHCNDVGKKSTAIRTRLKPDAKLQTQRPNKVPIHYHEKLNNLSDELQKKVY